VDLQEWERGLDPRLRTGESMADAYLAQMHERCRQWTGTILVAEVDGAVVGFAALYATIPYEELDDPPGEYALVSDLAVLHAMRGRGVGAALLDEAERRARDAGATELRIAVMSANDGAKRLYLRSGFAPYVETLSKSL
jgi:ribosomal protein S18 acetylase RimI-like enzyme